MNSQHIDPTCRGCLLTNIPTPYRNTFFQSLAAELRRHQVELKVLFCARSEPGRHWRFEGEGWQFPFEFLRGIHPRLKGVYPHFNPGIIRALRALQPAFLINAGAWNTPTMLLASQRRLCGPAYRVFWSEGHTDAVLHPGGVIARLRRRALNSYDAFAVPNARSADFLRAELRREVTVLPLPNTVDEAFFIRTSDRERQSARERLGVPAETTLFTQVSQLEPRKGVLELVTGYSALSAEERGRSRLAILGTGSLMEALREQVAKHDLAAQVRLPGHLEPEAVRLWLMASDCFVLASRQDPNPLSALEAAFAGLPLLLSVRAGNCQDLLRPGLNGMELGEIAPEAIARQLSQFLQLPAEAQRAMGERSRRIADAHFQREAVVRRFVARLLEAIRQGRLGRAWVGGRPGLEPRLVEHWNN